MSKRLRSQVLEGLRQGRPTTGPLQVHLDITNACNAACVTCWDHSPLLDQGRSNAWKRQRLDLGTFHDLMAQLDAFGSVGSIVLSGMGDPLVHPGVYEMIGAIKRRGWHLTLLTNLVAADMDQLEGSGVDRVLASVQGVTIDSYTAFHPGWTEQHFSTLCRYLRRLGRAGVETRHVQVINRDTAPELVEMVRFGGLFRAQRVNFKLASLYGGTQACSITDDQRAQLALDIPRARDLATALGVGTNLDLFEQQLTASTRSERHTTPVDQTGCAMGHVYTRIAVDGAVIFCCNTQVQVGSLAEHTLAELWWGDRWQSLREHLAAGRFFKGCEVCGKYEQNRTWSQRFGGPLHGGVPEAAANLARVARG